MAKWVVGTVVGLGLLATLVAGVLVVTTGGKACSKVGCVAVATFGTDSLDADLRARTAVYTLCIDERCEHVSSDDDEHVNGVSTALDVMNVASGSLTLEDAAGVVIERFDLAGPVEADLSFPNGEGCEPACPRLRLVVADGDLRKASA